MSRAALTLKLCTQAYEEDSQAVLPQGFHTVLVLYHKSAWRYAQPQGCALGKVPQPLACEHSRRDMAGIIQETKDGREYLHIGYQSGSSLLDAVPVPRMVGDDTEAVVV